MRRRPLAIVVGFIAKSPVAGMALYNLHYIAGLRELGFDVHYVERLNRPDECYDPELDEFGDNPDFGLRWLRRCIELIPGTPLPWTFIDRHGAQHGVPLRTLTKAISHADFVLTLADPTWFDELEACPRRGFVDGDPLFTQAAMREAGGDTAVVLAHYPTLFTYWTRQGAADTTVPSAGRTWISTTPVVATNIWEKRSPRGEAPVSTVMNWGAWGDVEVDGRLYGHKSREVERLIDLPSRTDRELLLAVGGPAPRDRLKAHGWQLANPLEATGTIPAYREFIAASYADLGICKHAYVASRSGWFSDRSLCYLASGRPVVHEDTGFTDWLPTGEGVFAFSTVEEAAAALRKLDENYPRHVRAARAIAEQHFEARTVIGRMLDEAGFR
jgi:hypothetical protein